MKAKLSVLICFSLFIAILITFCIFGIKTENTTAALGNLLLIYVITLVIGSVIFLAVDLVLRLRNITGYLDARTMPSLILIVLFSTTILLPLIGLALGMEAKLPNTENRKFAGKPTLSIEALRSFGNDFIAYFNDNFGFRKTLIHVDSAVTVRYFHVSPLSRVVLGKGNWLFYSEHVQEYQGWSPFSEEQLQTMGRKIEKQKDWLAERGIYYLLVIAPIKETVYPEYLPDNLRRYNQQTRLDQLEKYLEAHSDVKILDLREALTAAKTKYPVYYRTDTHWNKYGAFVSYCEIMRRLSTPFPDLQPPSSADYDVVTRSYPGNGILAVMLTLPGEFGEEEAQVVFKGNVTTNQQKLKSALMFGDSFVNGLEPYLSPNFEKFAKGKWLEGINYDMVLKEQPQVVIFVMDESDLAWFFLT